MSDVFKILKKYEGGLVPREVIDKLLVKEGVCLEQLLTVLSSKFVFHGSRKLVKELKPFKAQCYVSEDGCLTAVYATNIPAYALFKSLVKLKPKTQIFNARLGERLSFAASPQLIKDMEAGYIYVLDKKLFVEKKNDNLVYFKKITPAYIIPTRPEDFSYKVVPIQKSIDWEKVEKIITKVYRYKGTHHRFDHIKRVVTNAKVIAKKECPNFYNDVVIGAYLHDIGRHDDSGGNNHASKGAKIAERLLFKFWPYLDHVRIVNAIMHHSDGLVSNDPLIGTIWDADRLDFNRFGTKINPALLSTKTGRKMLKEKNKR